MKILDALKEKFNAKGTNIAEAIENIDKTFIASGEPDDGAVPTYNEETKDVEWVVPDEPASELPAVTSADNDKILKVVNGAWGKGDAPSGSELPAVNYYDNGKVLMVVDGVWNKGGGLTQFFAHATYITDDNENFTYSTCDKGTEEIIDAYNSGKDIVIFAKIMQSSPQYETDNCVILRVSGYKYEATGYEEPTEELYLGSAVLLNPTDSSAVTYQITVSGYNMPLELIKL